MGKFEPRIGPYPACTTPAEHDIIDLIFAGFTTKEIAERRGSSVRTVTTQLSEIFHKAHVHSKAELVAFITEELLLRSSVLRYKADGLTKRQTQVARYAAHGESSKVIAHKLGISPSSVSIALHGVMTKLGVKTRAELVARTHGLGTPPDGSTHSKNYV